MTIARTCMVALVAAATIAPGAASAQDDPAAGDAEKAPAEVEKPPSSDGEPGEQAAASGPDGEQADIGASASADPDPREVDGLLTETWEEPRVPIEPLWNIALLPERLIESLLFPVAGLVSVVETYRLDERVVDVLTNEEGTFKVTPKVNFGFPDGLGLGAAFTFDELLGGDERLDVSGRYRINGDFDTKARYRQTSARLEGRLIELLVGYEIDSNEPYYGIGADTDADDRRALRREVLDASAAIDLNAQGSLLLSGKLLLGFSQRRLAPGNDLGQIPVGEMDDDVEVPPGFEETLSYPRLGMVLQFDNRDRKGRPTRGTLARFEGALTSDVNGADLNAAYARLSVNQFIQLLPIYRILVLTGGVGVSKPLENDAEVPYHELVTLGRRNFLRGYRRDRFKGEYGWWASAQYQFPLGEYMNTDVALSGALFVDAGQIANQVDEFLDHAIRYNYGIGLGIRHTSKSVVSLFVARSEEGIEFAVAGGLEL